jgi:hypothetical protein
MSRRRDKGGPADDKPKPRPEPKRGGAGDDRLAARLRAQVRKLLGKHYANKYRTGGR